MAETRRRVRSLDARIAEMEEKMQRLRDQKQIEEIRNRAARRRPRRRR